MTQYEAGDPVSHQTHAEPGSGMAITAFVLALLSWVCLGPLAGLPALILGIIALVKANKTPPEQGGKGLSIAAIAVGGVGTLASLLILPLLIGIFLPALGKARQTAMRLQSSANVRTIVQGIVNQSSTNQDQFPQTATDWQQNLIDGGYALPGDFVSPYTDGIGDDYFLVPGGRNDFDASHIVVYEDPTNDPFGTLIGYADANVEWIEQAQSMQILSNLTLPDGTPWTPHLTGGNAP